MRYRDEANGIDEQRAVPADGEEARRDCGRCSSSTATRRRTRCGRVMRAVDGNDVDSGWSVSDEEQITVRNPFRARTLAVLAERVVGRDPRRSSSTCATRTRPTTCSSRRPCTSPRATNPPTFVVDLRDPTQTADRVHGDLQLPRRPGEAAAALGDLRAAHHRRSPDKLGHRVVEVRPPADWEAAVGREGDRGAAVRGLHGEPQLRRPVRARRAGRRGRGSSSTTSTWPATATSGARPCCSRTACGTRTDWTASADPVLVPRLP